MVLRVPFRIQPPVLYAAKAMDNQGTASIYTDTLLGHLPDSKTVTVSYWFKPDGLPEDRDMLMQGRGGAVKMEINIDGTDIGLQVFMDNDVLNFTIDDGTFTEDVWNHLAFSVDLTDTGKRHVYLDGSDISSSVTWNLYNNTNMEFQSITDADFAVCSHKGLGIRFFDGFVSDIWWSSEYIDLDSDIDKFIDGSGKPVDLGVDGSTPTGTQPEIYFPCDYNDPGANEGTANDYSVHNTFIDAADSPSD